ncbi:hypothetical protein CVT25_006160 [Psilocybe cyanescens]|uniref:Uncharacterized protein n=1 Tax=Psilocybe cyanescens TaxID=93625 RepID=A0A409X701_PSICY|nr:hypothetical protein CVT25_006160 [Psilocybe cyanescens]
MDLRKFPNTNLYDAHIRPNYPTPPPSFDQLMLPQDHSSFQNEVYPYPPLSPSVSSSGSYNSFAQSPTPFGSLPPSPLPMDLSLSAASLLIDSLSPELDETDSIISISTSFHPNTQPTPDTIFASSDGVLFYIRSETVLTACPTAFIAILKDPLSHPKFRDENILLDVPSAELNVIFHALYGTSPAANSPTFETLVQAVDRMPMHSLPPQTLVRPSGSLHELLLFHAPLHPMETYALAAHHKLHSLAVSVSSHLLSYDLSTISDDMAERIGAIYLKKIMLLHMGRFTALKAILLHPPHPHPPSKECGFEDQRKLTRAWALVSAYLAWDARPADLSTHSMHSALNPLMEHLSCAMCHQALEDKIKAVVVQWASVKRTV